jgi:hypothetical protein
VNLEAHKCYQAKLPSGKTFSQFCIEKMSANPPIPLAPRCLAKLEVLTAPKCPEVETVCNP